MKLVSARQSDGQVFLGRVEDDRVFPIPGFVDVSEVIAGGVEMSELAEPSAASAPLALSSLELLAPVRPPAMRDSMGFHEHIRNCGTTGSDPGHSRFPTFYITNHNAVIGPQEDVRIPPGCAEFDYELEIGAVLGREVTNPTVEEAEAAIAGYLIYVDWSARDLQMEEMALGLGPAKGKDSATTLGPYFLTADELEERRSGLGYDIRMRARVNGRIVTDGNWNTVDWGFGDVIAYAARGTTLSAGEVLGSGTVGRGCLFEHAKIGSGLFEGWLRAGDVVEMEVDLMGSTSQTIVAGLPRHPLSSGY